MTDTEPTAKKLWQACVRHGIAAVSAKTPTNTPNANI